MTELVASQDRDMTDDKVTAFEALRTRIDSESTPIDREATLIADESRIGLATLAGPNVTDMLKQFNKLGNPGHFASVEATSVDDPSDPDAMNNGNVMPLYRGHRLHIKYEGLQPL